MANAKQCDRCKIFYIEKRRPYPYMEVRRWTVGAQSYGYDLCDDCLCALVRFMLNEEVEYDNGKQNT